MLVDPFDADDIADGITRALSDHENLAEAGKLRVSERYTWEQTARGYLDAIEGKLHQPPRQPGAIGELDATTRITEYLAAG